MKIRKVIVGVLLGVLSCSAFSYVGAVQVAGEIKNITSAKSGLMIKVGNNEVPENCNSGQTWMIIDKEDSTMISAVFAVWAMGRGVAVYTSTGTSGY